MSRQWVCPGYAKRRIAYHANAVAVVCTALKTNTAMSAPREIDVIVSQTSSNQPRTSQPSRLATAAMKTMHAIHVSQRRHGKRCAAGGDTGIAWVAVGLDIRSRRVDRARDADVGRHPERMMMRAECAADTGDA